MADADLDMYSILVISQCGGLQPKPILSAARRAVALGEGGEHTQAVAALSDQIGNDTVEALDAHLDGLREEWSVERLDSTAAAERILHTLCRRIVDGELAPGTGAAIIGHLRTLPSTAGLPWETVRPFFAAAEDLHPDDGPSEALRIKVEREIIAEASRVLSG